MRFVRPDLTAAVTEKQLQGQVLQMARLRGWWAYHTYDSRRSQPGWPDLVLLHEQRGVALFRELKTDKGRLDPHQRDVLRRLDACGLDADVWRPKDLDEIIAQL